jgi:predicted heme/steroid binding protein
LIAVWMRALDGLSNIPGISWVVVSEGVAGNPRLGRGRVGVLGSSFSSSFSSIGLVTIGFFGAFGIVIAVLLTGDLRVIVDELKPTCSAFRASSSACICSLQPSLLSFGDILYCLYCRGSITDRETGSRRNFLGLLNMRVFKFEAPQFHPGLQSKKPSCDLERGISSTMTTISPGSQSPATPVVDLPQSPAEYPDVVGYVLPLVSSPTNIVLFVILLYVAYLRIRPRSISHPSVISDEPLVFTYYTPTELAVFDGKTNKRILMGIRGRVYDVTAGANFYGPGGPYGNFAGRDASRGLSKDSFDEGSPSCPLSLTCDRYDYSTRPAHGSHG